MESRLMVSVHMYDPEAEKKSAKCRSRPQDGTTGNAHSGTSATSSTAKPIVELGKNDIEITVQRNRGPWVRAAQLPELFCSWDLAYRCRKGGWLRPIVRGKRRTIYRLTDVLACMQRIEAGELPLPRRNKTTP